MIVMIVFPRLIDRCRRNWFISQSRTDASLYNSSKRTLSSKW